MPTIMKLDTEEDLNAIVKVLEYNLRSQKEVKVSVIIGPRELMDDTYENM